MAWNPDIYNKFKTEHYATFYDLLNLCHNKPGIKGIDLGCGTGELTSKLSAHLPGAELTGVDSSKEMLSKASAFENNQLRDASWQYRFLPIMIILPMFSCMISLYARLINTH